MSPAFLALCAVVVLGAVLRFPVVLIMFCSGVLYLWVSGQDLGIIVDQTLNSSFEMTVLIAVPMFILAGNVMNAATISERLWGAADALVGRFRGGMGHVTILMNLVMSSLSGSAVSEAAGAGMVATRMMRKVGNYPGGLSVAITAAASCLAPMVPPSIPMVIYALISGASIGALFMAGIVPALIMTVALMAMIVWMARRHDLPRGRAVPLSELPGVLARTAVPMTLPVILLGGIWTGIFTPTESATVAAFWAMVLGVLVYRNVGLRGLAAVFVQSMRQSAAVMLLIFSSFIVNYAFTSEGLSQSLAGYVMGLDLSPVMFLLLVNLMFLVLGTVLDGAVMLLVLVPVLLPAVHALGIDLVHFGVVATLNFMIAIISPPYGLILFVLSALSGVPIGQINRAIWPFCFLLVGVLLLLVLFPGLSLWLPRMFGYGG